MNQEKVYLRVVGSRKKEEKKEKKECCLHLLKCKLIQPDTAKSN